MPFSYLHLGSNQGHKVGHIVSALVLIEKEIGPIHATSSFYETAAWGVEEQEDFVNMAIKVETYLSPTELILAVAKIENKLGRKRVVKWGPRIIDIDIILYGDLVIKQENLEIPHPRMGDRRFVLVPMVEIAADDIHPITKLTLKEMLDECADQLTVKKLKVYQ